MARKCVTFWVLMNREKVNFVDSAEHVGFLCSTEGNSVSIFARIKAHKKALGAFLHTGMALGYRGTPAASLQVVQVYGVPVLLSGQAALVLNKAEETIIEQHHKQVVMNIQRLRPCTPCSDTYFLTGTLP